MNRLNFGLTFITIIFLLPINIQAQNEFETAYAFQKHSDSKLPDDFEQKLSNRDTIDQNMYNAISEFIKNPWTAEGKNLDHTVFDRIEKTTKSPLIPLTSLVGIDYGSEMITKITHALGNVLFERAKAELTASYLSQIRSHLKVTKIKGTKASLKDVFPNFYELLSSDEFISPSIGKSMRTALEEDIKDLYENVEKYVIPDDYKKEFKYKLASSAYFCLQEINRGTHAAILLNKLTYKFPLESTVAEANKFNSIISILNQISESLRNRTGKNDAWISSNKLKELNLKGIEYYIALLMANNEKAFNTLGLNRNNINKIKDKQDLLSHIWLIIHEIYSNLNYFENDIFNEGKKETTSKGGLDGMLPKETTDSKNENNKIVGRSSNNGKTFYLSGTKIINILEAVNRLPYVQNLNLYQSNDIDKALDAARDILDIHEALRNNEYTIVVFKTISIVRNVTSDDFELPNRFVKYAAFAADIAAADSLEEIEALIDAAILPLGSFQMKRKTSSSAFINSYVGINGGGEWANEDKLKNKWAFQFSPLASIGAEYSWSGGEYSNSIYLSIIDLGALVSHRFQNNNSDSVITNELPAIDFVDIFSPGIFYVHGFKNSPISFGAGVNITPDLRQISDAGKKIGEVAVVKISAFLAVDIPLFRLYSSSKIQN